MAAARSAECKHRVRITILKIREGFRDIQRWLYWGMCALRPGQTDYVLINCTRLQYFSIKNTYPLPLQAALSDGVSSHCPYLKFVSSQKRHFTRLEIILMVKSECNVASSNSKPIRFVTCNGITDQGKTKKDCSFQ